MVTKTRSVPAAPFWIPRFQIPSRLVPVVDHSGGAFWNAWRVQLTPGCRSDGFAS
jgi:hypothetical protein